MDDLASDVQTVVRCPYCTSGFEFMPMVPHDDGYFICPDCGHCTKLGLVVHHCNCQHCQMWNSGFQFQSKPA